MTIYRVSQWDARSDRIWQYHTDRLFADGGCIGSNPSTGGGTWAWCAVDAEGWMIHAESGWFSPPTAEEGGRADGTVGNNQSELLAVLLGLRQIKAERPDWAGTVLTDSLLTIRRWTQGASLASIPYLWRYRMGEILRMPGTIGNLEHWALLDGHPTREQLIQGIGKRGNPVSVHNVHCDTLCKEAVRAANGSLTCYTQEMLLTPLDSHHAKV